MIARTAILLSAAAALLVACGPAIAPPSTETMPEAVMVKSDPAADTSHNASTSHGGCGGVFNPCPDVLNPQRKWPFRVGCLGCSQGSGRQGASTALLVALVFLPLRQRRRYG